MSIGNTFAIWRKFVGWMLAVNVINMLEGINADVLPFPGSLIFLQVYILSSYDCV